MAVVQSMDSISSSSVSEDEGSSSGVLNGGLAANAGINLFEFNPFDFAIVRKFELEFSV